MKSFRGEWMRGALALLATSAGCALVGYDLSGYQKADTTGAGGAAAGTTSAGTPGSTASQSTGTSVSAGPGGTGGTSAEAGTTSASSGDGSTGSGTGACKVDTDCDDNNLCTLNHCNTSTGQCVFTQEFGCCPHSVCKTGLPLSGTLCVFEDKTKAVDCVADVCGTKPACCSVGWTQDCVDLAKTSCLPIGTSNPPAFSCGCAHSYCVEGEVLDRFCDPCVHAICSQVGYEFCCNPVGGFWEVECVQAVTQFCHVPWDSALCQ